MKAAFITLSREGATLFARLAASVGEVDFFLHESVGPMENAILFTRIQDVTADLFPRYRALIFAVPCGVVVRALTGCVQHKTTDPAVVVLDVGARWSISLLSGHEGGANALAVRIANALGAEPVITTTTEAVKDVIAGVGCRRGVPASQIVSAVRSALERGGVTLSQVRLLASADVKANEPGLHEAATELGVALRFITSTEIRMSVRAFKSSAFVQTKVGIPAVAEPAALLAGRRTRLFLPKTKYPGVTVALARECCTWSELDREAHLDRTRRAEQVILKSDVIAGYRTYIELVADLTGGKRIIATAMTQELDRVEAALRFAQAGETVSLISSGDAGIYGMAGLAIEQAAALGINVPIEIVPGVSAAGAAAARLGAPLMLDFACISLSDLLVDWAQIVRRLEAVASADLAVALYNPRSHKRVRQLEEAAAIFRHYRPLTTPVGIATAIGLPGEHIVISDLGHFTAETIGMRTTVLIGNSTTRIVGRQMVTPRGYRL